MWKCLEQLFYGFRGAVVLIRLRSFVVDTFNDLWEYSKNMSLLLVGFLCFLFFGFLFSWSILGQLHHGTELLFAYVRRVSCVRQLFGLRPFTVVGWVKQTLNSVGTHTLSKFLWHNFGLGGNFMHRQSESLSTGFFYSHQNFSWKLRCGVMFLYWFYVMIILSLHIRI